VIRNKKIIRDLKLFLRIFVVIFVILFIVFDGTAFGAIVAYKFHRFVDALVSPPKISNLAGNPSYASSTALVLPPIPVEASQTNMIELPEFNITAPIWQVKTPDLNTIYAKLRQGVVLYPGTAIPGQGYSIIIGHSSQYPWQPGRYKAVFSLLSQLEIGDKIYIFWDGKPLVFQVVDKKIFLPWPKGTEMTETLFPPENKPILIIQSCWPAGVAFKRVAVKTILLNPSN
jgi:LPXTG-site transpeptidase (sortase) family protein